MIRMKNRIGQVVVGEDYLNPLDCDVTNVWTSKDVTKGKVEIHGKKHPVKCLGGGVWMLVDGYTIPHQLPMRKQA